MKKRIISTLLLMVLLFVNTETFGARRRSSSRSRSSSSSSRSYSSGSSSIWSSGSSSSRSSLGSSSSSRSYSSGSPSNSSFQSSYSGKTVESGATTSKKAYDSYTSKETTSENTSANSGGNQNYESNTWGTTSRPLRDSYLYIDTRMPVNRTRIYTSGNKINTKTNLTNDELLSLVMEIPDEEAIRYFEINRKSSHIKGFVKELNSLNSSDEEFNKKVSILNDRLKKLYKADSQSKTNKILLVLLLGGLTFAGCYAVREKKKKEAEKDNEISLPFGLEVGSYLEFDELLFSNLDYDSKFFLNNHKNIIRSCGVSKVGKTKIINLYLDNEHEKNIYLQLHMEKDQVKKSILFKNLDIIYPKDSEEWNSWIGKSGMLGDDTFFIHDIAKDVVQDGLYKFIKRVEPSFNEFSSASVQFRDNILKTNILDKVTKGSVEKERILISEYKKDNYLNKIITSIKKEDKGHKLTLDLYEADNYIEMEYENISGGKYERLEREEGNNTNKTEALYSRPVDGEFFEEEYVLLSSRVEDQRAYISIDVGVHIDLDLYKI